MLKFSELWIFYNQCPFQTHTPYECSIPIPRYLESDVVYTKLSYQSHFDITLQNLYIGLPFLKNNAQHVAMNHSTLFLKVNTLFKGDFEMCDLTRCACVMPHIACQMARRSACPIVYDFLHKFFFINMFTPVAKPKIPHLSMHPCKVNNTHVVHFLQGQPNINERLFFRNS